MHNKYWKICVLVGVTLLGYSPRVVSTPEPTHWLAADQIEKLVATVPAPPTPDSEADRVDLAAVLAAQNGRSPAVEAECNRDEHFSKLLFATVYGSDLTPENSPRFHDLMTVILKTTDEVNETAKNRFRRARPYRAHGDVVRALFEVRGYSYPSGHSMASFTLATVLGTLFPEKQQALLDRAAQIAQSRVDAGVHYPTDIREGEALGKSTALVILATPEFQAAKADVVAELKR